jgi:hypothetical protein
MGYGASIYGDVLNFKTHRIIGALSTAGYIILGLEYIDGKQVHMRRNRFVWECYHGIIEGKLIVDHINNKEITNDTLSNLQIMTQIDNSLKSYSQGRIHGNTSGNPRKVIASNLSTNEEREFPSITNAGKVLNIYPNSIQSCCKGIQHTATSKLDGVKYTFRYKK